MKKKILIWVAAMVVLLFLGMGDTQWDQFLNWMGF